MLLISPAAGLEVRAHLERLNRHDGVAGEVAPHKLLSPLFCDPNKGKTERPISQEVWKTKAIG